MKKYKNLQDVLVPDEVPYFLKLTVIWTVRNQLLLDSSPRCVETDLLKIQIYGYAFWKMSLIQYVLMFLLIGTFVLLLGILFLVWFSKYAKKPTRFFLPTVVSNTANLELDERLEIFEPREIEIPQFENTKIRKISELGKSNMKSIPTNFGKKFYFTETEI